MTLVPLAEGGNFLKKKGQMYFFSVKNGPVEPRDVYSRIIINIDG